MCVVGLAALYQFDSAGSIRGAVSVFSQEIELIQSMEFVLAAYAVGACVVFGFAIKLIRERVHLRTFIQSLESSDEHET